MKMKRLPIMLLMGNRLKQDFGLMMAGQVGRRGSEEVRLAVVSASILQGDGQGRPGQRSIVRVKKEDWRWNKPQYGV